MSWSNGYHYTDNRDFVDVSLSEREYMIQNMGDSELAEQLYNLYYDHLITIPQVIFSPFSDRQEYIQERWIAYAKAIKNLDTSTFSEISELSCDGCKWNDHISVNQLTNKYVLCPFCPRYYKDRYESGE